MLLDCCTPSLGNDVDASLPLATVHPPRMPTPHGIRAVAASPSTAFVRPLFNQYSNIRPSLHLHPTCFLYNTSQSHFPPRISLAISPDRPTRRLVLSPRLLFVHSSVWLYQLNHLRRSLHFKNATRSFPPILPRESLTPSRSSNTASMLRLPACGKCGITIPSEDSARSSIMYRPPTASIAVTPLRPAFPSFCSLYLPTTCSYCSTSFSPLLFSTREGLRAHYLRRSLKTRSNHVCIPSIQHVSQFLIYYFLCRHDLALCAFPLILNV